MTLSEPLVRTLPVNTTEPDAADLTLAREWLVTNGLGGYASGTVSGVITRRFHGLLVAALPAPHGRTMMLHELLETVHLPDGQEIVLGGEERVNAAPALRGTCHLQEFRLERGLPVWVYQLDGYRLEKRLVLPYRQNTVHVTYQLLSGEGQVRLRLRPALHFRPHEGAVDAPLGGGPYVVSVMDDRYEFSSNPARPPLRMRACGHGAAFTFDKQMIGSLLYRIEKSRGYDYAGNAWSPGYFHAGLSRDRGVSVVASTESWEVMEALDSEAAMRTELARREALLAGAVPAARVGMGAELVLAADQFIFTPVGRIEDVARANAAGDEVRSVIAGYHWFTDWGRDTMISLEGLTLVTGRMREAGWILRTFAYYVKDGLIPNMFPEGRNEGLYHTADASLWFFQAVHRYQQYTNDRATLRGVLPKLREIAERHLAGTRFGIRIDPADGLMTQGAPGYQLTWMDAKVDDWVVTPRRGKTVELNALWYNALRLLQGWMSEAGDYTEARRLSEHADRCRESFNQRFWNAKRGCLFDIVDTEGGGDDPAVRPNQLFAIALEHPVLDPARWRGALEVCREQLLTPVGLRSLEPGHPDYQPKYDGDLRARDAAYHQGTVWGWLIGPYVDAYLRVFPEDKAGARRLLEGFGPHLDEFGVGSIAEIFDAEPPFHPRGCMAQAWSIAEVLRCWVRTA